MASNTTLIQNADWVIGWDPDQSEHVYLNNVDIAFQGDQIIHVGSNFTGKADTTIDGKNLLVMPGLINIHSHPASEPMNKGINDELGSPRLYNTSLYEFMPLFRPDAEGTKACVQVAYSELLMSGVTTLVDISGSHPEWLDLMAKSGLRGVLAPAYRSAVWGTKNGHTVEYDWDEAAGRANMEAAIKLIEEAERHVCGRLSGMISPSQIDTCTPELLKDSLDAAVEKNLPLQIHASQSVVEFHEMVRRHGITPIEWLHQLGLLTPRTIIGHGIFLDHHSSIHWHTRTDLDRLSQSGTTVAHCPTVFSRRGMRLEDFAGYLKAGVNMGIGTDTYPHNMIEELRAAIIFGRIVSGQIRPITREVFNAATIGGAKALNREDIGRLQPGAKADLVLVDLSLPVMKPCREPLRSLIYVAAERAVKDVYIDGQLVVSNGKVKTFDYETASQALHEAQARTLKNVANLDWANRTAEEVSPLTFPRRN